MSNPLPILVAGVMAANSTQRFSLSNTAGIIVQSVIIDTDALLRFNSNIWRKKGIRQHDATTNITYRDYIIIDGQKVLDFYKGFEVQEDIEITLTNPHATDTIEFEITIMTARKDHFQFLYGNAQAEILAEGGGRPFMVKSPERTRAIGPIGP